MLNHPTLRSVSDVDMRCFLTEQDLKTTRQLLQVIAVFWNSNVHDCVSGDAATKLIRSLAEWLDEASDDDACFPILLDAVILCVAQDGTPSSPLNTNRPKSLDWNEVLWKIVSRCSEWDLVAAGKLSRCLEKRLI